MNQRHPRAGPAAVSGTECEGTFFAQIPDHELIRKIDSGCYGEVWLARNALGTYRAVKIVYRSNFSHARPFDREFTGIQKYEPVSRSQGGLMDILQVGRNEQGGYFYYVMELADDVSSGQTINPESYTPRTLAYERSHRGHLPFDECLSVGLALSSALAALHKHGLVHRDVKPSNIVFVNGVPELADIGLVTDVEEARSYVGTEGFIPPEGPGTPQADIYSLGKVLYELSTGMDRQEYPLLPTSLGDTESRHELLELNEIVLKACRADPAERYKTAERMQADLLLLQRGRSIKQVRKLQRRLAFARRTGIIAAVAALLAIGAWVGSIKQIRRARAAEKTAKSEAAKSEALAAFFLDDLLMEGSPERNPDRNITLRAALDKAAAKIDKRFTNQLEVAAATHATLGEVYLTLDVLSEAEAHHQKGLELRRQVLGPEHADTLESQDRVATIRQIQGRPAEAEALFRTNLATRLRVLGKENIATLSSVNNLVVFLLDSWRPAEAEVLLRQYLPTMEHVAGKQAQLTLGCEVALSQCLRQLGKMDEALRIIEQVYEPYERALGPEHPHVLSAAGVYATVLQDKGRLSEAEPIFRNMVATRRRVQGDDHWNTLIAIYNLAICLAREGKYEEALTFFSETADGYRKQYGIDDAGTLNCMTTKGLLLLEVGRSAEAEALLTDVLQRRRKVSPQWVSDTILGLGEALTQNGKAAQAEPLLREALEIRRNAVPQSRWGIAEAQSGLGGCLSSLGRYEEAEPLLLEACNTFRDPRNLLPFLPKRAHQRLVTLYQAWGKPDKALYWQSMFVDLWKTST